MSLCLSQGAGKDSVHSALCLTAELRYLSSLGSYLPPSYCLSRVKTREYIGIIFAEMVEVD